MSLLARYAEHLFWLARYTERAASLAGTIGAHAVFDQSRAAGSSWGWLLKLYAEDDAFAKRKLELTGTNVLNFYTLDPEHPSSIVSNMNMARDNARALRAVLPNEVWEQMNRFCNDLKQFDPQSIDPVELSRTCAILKSRCHAQIGVMVSTLYRDEGWQFYKLGRAIERTDQTSRLLDFKFAQRAAVEDPGDTLDEETVIAEEALWALVLRSAGAHQAFHRVEKRAVDSERVVSFLMCNAYHPRSLTYCIGSMREAIEALLLRVPNHHASRTLAELEKLEHFLSDYAQKESLLAGLHAFNDGLQQRLISLTTAVGTAYFLSGQTEDEQVQEQTIDATSDAESKTGKKSKKKTKKKQKGEGKRKSKSARQSQTQSNS